MIRKVLLRLYPAAWRKEYGEEFADVLVSSRLTVRAVANVLWSAACQRLRHAPLWLLSGVSLFLFELMQLLLQSFGLLSPHTWLFAFESLALAGTGLSITAGRDGSFASGLAGIIKAGLVSQIPDFVVFAYLFTPTAVSIPVMGRHFSPASRLEEAGIEFVVVAVYAALLGCCGASCGSIVKRLRGRRA